MASKLHKPIHKLNKSKPLRNVFNLTEVMRFKKFYSSTNSRLGLDTVCKYFSEIVPPSHICIEDINFPAKQ